MTRNRADAKAPSDQPLNSEQGARPAAPRKKKQAPQPEKVASKSTIPANVQPDAIKPTDTATIGFPIAGVGASAGGLEAYRRLLQALPVDTGVAFVLVQHLDPTHASLLAEILSRSTRMSVREVTGQTPIEPNAVYVIPPGRSIVLSGNMLSLLPREETRAPHRPVDTFLRSLAESRHHSAIGVILSGTGNDGTQGLEAIKAEGGITFAQNETAQQDGMPRSAIAAGCADFVLSPDAIAHELSRIGHHLAIPANDGRSARESASERMLGRLREVTGVDFSQYRFSTLYRRITRRMLLHKLDTLPDYLQLLERDAAEVHALYSDILISVTSFFRDPDAFAVLSSRVFPQLAKNRARQEPVRVWTVGCSTGEEAYSLAIALTEFGGEESVPVQVFGTDLNDEAIQKARIGLYPKSI